MPRLSPPPPPPPAWRASSPPLPYYYSGGGGSGPVPVPSPVAGVGGQCRPSSGCTLCTSCDDLGACLLSQFACDPVAGVDFTCVLGYIPPGVEAYYHASDVQCNKKLPPQVAPPEDGALILQRVIIGAAVGGGTVLIIIVCTTAVLCIRFKRRTGRWWSYHNHKGEASSAAQQHAAGALQMPQQAPTAIPQQHQAPAAAAAGPHYIVTDIPGAAGGGAATASTTSAPGENTVQGYPVLNKATTAGDNGGPYDHYPHFLQQRRDPSCCSSPDGQEGASRSHILLQMGSLTAAGVGTSTNTTAGTPAAPESSTTAAGGAAPVDNSQITAAEDVSVALHYRQA